MATDGGSSFPERLRSAASNPALQLYQAMRILEAEFKRIPSGYGAKLQTIDQLAEPSTIMAPAVFRVCG